MTSFYRKILKIINNVFVAWSSDKILVQSAALSFYAIFSLGPLLLLVLYIATLAFESDIVKLQLFGQVQGIIGKSGTDMVERMVAYAEGIQRSRVMDIVGVVLLIVIATNVLNHIQQALNAIWGVKSKKSAVIAEIRKRAFSFAIIVCIGVMVILTLVLNIILVAFFRYASEVISLPSNLVYLSYNLLMMILLTCFFMVIYKIIPDRKVPWRPVIVGAITTTVLFMFGKVLVGLYLSHSTIRTAYGSASSMIVIMLWTYYTAQIFFFGAELTKVLTFSIRRYH